VAYRPEDIVLSTAAVEAETSAINRVSVHVDALVPAEALTRVRLRVDADPAITLTALLTRRSAGALGLAVGVGAAAFIKATALHAWPSDR
jgi:molybdopterin-binding protein